MRRLALLSLLLLAGCAGLPTSGVTELRGIRVVYARAAQVDAACRKGGVLLVQAGNEIKACNFPRYRIIHVAGDVDPHLRARYLCHEIAHLYPLIRNWHAGRDDASAGPLWDEKRDRCTVRVAK